MKGPLIIGEGSRNLFRLPLELVTQSVAILAKRGSGKSYTSAVFVEELLDAGQVPVIIDPTGAHWGLKSSADGKKAAYPVVVFGGEHADLPLEETAGEAVAQAIVEQRFPAIIDLSLFRKGQVRRFVTPFLETLYRLNRLPLMLVVDEADDICPQKVGPEEAQMVGALEDVVKRGRKKGIGCTLITQRPADLAKQVLTQCEMLVAMRLVHPLDIKAVKEWVNVHADLKTAEEMIASLPSLPTGTAWFWSPGWGDIFDRVEVRARRTFDSGATPKPGEKRIEPSELAVIDIGALGEKIKAAAERAKENDPAHLKREIERLKKEKLNRPAEKEIIRLPVFSDDEKNLITSIHSRASDAAEEFLKLNKQLQNIVEVAVTRAEKAHVKYAADERAPFKAPVGIPLRRGELVQLKTLGESVAIIRHANGSLPKGELAVLTAVAQHPAGCTREQLTVLTGYKRSSRDAYIQRLRERGMVEVYGNQVVKTPDGQTALGPDFKPLPTGDELRKHWLERLPKGEKEILFWAIESYPNSVLRDTITERTGYKRSSRDAYIQRLSARQLIDTVTGGVRANETLFS